MLDFVFPSSSWRSAFSGLSIKTTGRKSLFTGLNSRDFFWEFRNLCRKKPWLTYLVVRYCIKTWIYTTKMI